MCTVIGENNHQLPASMQGAIPLDLHGTLLRNGPGNFDYGHSTLSNMFDGDGLITAFAFDGGDVTVRRRFVRTKVLKQEMTSGLLP